MRSYKQIRAEIAKLEREADAARKAEAAATIDRLKKLIALYGLTAEDIGLGAASRTARRSRSSADSATRKVGARKETRPQPEAEPRRSRPPRRAATAAATDGDQAPAVADATQEPASDEAGQRRPAAKAKRSRPAPPGGKQASSRRRPAARKSAQRAEAPAAHGGDAVPAGDSASDAPPAEGRGDEAAAA